MTDGIAIHGHNIIDLISTYPDGIRLSQLMEVLLGICFWGGALGGAVEGIGEG